MRIADVPCAFVAQLLDAATVTRRRQSKTFVGCWNKKLIKRLLLASANAATSVYLRAVC